MYAKIRPRRSTTTEWEIINPVLKEGELGIEFPDSGIGTGLCKFKVGDGTTQWSSLPYAFDAAAALAIYGGGVTLSHDIRLRSGTTDEWNTENPKLKVGEIVFDISDFTFDKNLTVSLSEDTIVGYQVWQVFFDDVLA